MHRGDSSRQKSSDRSHDRRCASSPRGSSASRSEGGRREEEARSTWGGEVPRDSRSNVEWIRRSNWMDGGRGESSRGRQCDTMSASMGRNDTTSKHSSGGVESSSRPREGRDEPANGYRSERGNPASRSIDRRRSPPPSHPSPNSPLPPPAGTQHTLPQPVTKDTFPLVPTLRKPEDDLSLPVRHETVTSSSNSSMLTSGDKRKHYWHRLTCVFHCHSFEYADIDSIDYYRRPLRFVMNI